MDWSAFASGAMDMTNTFAGLLNSKWDRDQSRENTNKTIAANRELAQYAYEQEMSQLEYMNEYNTPANQKARLIEAGLNPALMYNSTPQNVQTKTAEYKAPQISYHGNQAMNVPMLEMSNLQKYMDMKVKSAQVGVLEQQKDLVDQQGFNERIKGRDLSNAADLKSQLWQYNQDSFKLKIEQQKQELDRITNENKLRELGIYPGDPVYWRLLFSDPKKLINSVKDAYKEVGFKRKNKYKW